MATARRSGSFWAAADWTSAARNPRTARGPEGAGAGDRSLEGAGGWGQPGVWPGQAGACEGDAAPNPRTPDPHCPDQEPSFGLSFSKRELGGGGVGIPVQWPLSASETQDFLSSAAPGLTGAVLTHGRES